jgi:hypothetical protein
MRLASEIMFLDKKKKMIDPTAPPVKQIATLRMFLESPSRSAYMDMKDERKTNSGK